MYEAKRPLVQPVIFFLIAAAIVLAACGGQLTNVNWPGLTTSGERAYVAAGPAVYAVDVGERQALWTFPEEQNRGLSFFAAPSVGEERVILGDFGVSSGMFSPGTTVTIYALENAGAQSGTPDLLWSRDDLAEDRIVAPPLQAGDQLFVGTADNVLLALDAQTGEQQWQFETEHSIWAQPLYHEGLVYVASLDNNLYALSADNGEEIWRVELTGSIASTPAFEDGVLYVPSFDRALHAVDAATGNELWTAPAEDWVWGSPAVGSGAVFYADISGNVYAVGAEDGQPIWSTEAGEAVQSALLYKDGVVYVASGQTEGDAEARTGQLLALDAETGNEIWRRQTPAPVFTGPEEVGDNIILALDDQGILMLLVYNPESGDLVWEYTPPAAE